mmetsp:Transcript_113283/g.199980  ORF Transcript_113283/g.199980 Transcript_113283/m.199980 type:complete len:88 (+) Transcript_113283:2-265(+)
MREIEPFNPGDQVEVFGLQSESGKKLNGKTGQVTKFDTGKGRYQVELRGLAVAQSLKPENLRRVVTISSAPTLGSDYTGSTAGYTLL